MDLTDEQIFSRLLDECDVYFDDFLISKEILLKNYFKFLTSKFSNSQHSLVISQDTDSICFSVMSFLAAAIQCLIKSQRDCTQIICALEPGDYVLYQGKERCIWDGFLDQNCDPADYEKAVYAKLMQPDKGNQIIYTPRSKWNEIIPYNGNSTRTDGRGIRKLKSGRNDFLSFLFKIPAGNFPGVTDTSAVFDTDQELFKRIYYSTEIKYGDKKSIKFCDIVTASYFTSTSVEQQYGSNPAKTEPVLKVTSNISTARQLVFNKTGNKINGFLMTSADRRLDDDSELIDLLERKSLNFSMLSTTIDSASVQNLIKTHEEAELFVCNKGFLKQKSGSVSQKNKLTLELERQVERIINVKAVSVLVDSEITWDRIREVKNSLSVIRYSELDSSLKDNFVATAYSLLNIILTAVFPLEKLNKFFEQDSITVNINVTSPEMKLRKLIELANSTELSEQFSNVVRLIQNLYNHVVDFCPKQDILLDILKKHRGKTIVVIVPKEYYKNFIYLALEENGSRGITVMTVNRFKTSSYYDVVISVGNIVGKNFDPIRCHSAEQVFVLLYDGEQRLFLYREHVSESYEQYVNGRLGLSDTEVIKKTEEDFNDAVAVNNADSDLEKYIERISSFDIYSFAGKFSLTSKHTPMTEVYAVGSFITGEKIIFTKHYQVVSLDKNSEKVIEKNVDSLEDGDEIVFVSRDDNTRNMVDYIYSQLLESGRISENIAEATRKSMYWKQLLRKYKEAHDFSYGDLAGALRNLGLSTQEVSVRQWLMDDSHIIGPREENTLKQIANLTQDQIMLTSYHEIFTACEVVRRQRLRILKLIGEAVKAKLSGTDQSHDDLMNFVFENVEALSEILELSNISILKDSVSVPTALTNRPIDETEMEI